MADFSIVPMGVGTSVSSYVAACDAILKDPLLNLTTQLHSYGTNVHGHWHNVFEALRRCHMTMHEMGAPRVSSSLRLGTRTDKRQTLADKLRSVHEKQDRAKVAGLRVVDDR